MLETLFELPFTLRRHREAPLLEERQQFQSHLVKQGTTKSALQPLASRLIHVVRLLKLEKLRAVDLEQIDSRRGMGCRRSFTAEGNGR